MTTFKMNIFEQELLERCKKGERLAQKQLYEIYSPKFHPICLRYNNWHIEDAKDTLQESFLKIFLNIDKFRGDGSFEGWMRRIVVNENLQYLLESKKFKVEITDLKKMPESTIEPEVDTRRLSRDEIQALFKEANLPLFEHVIYHLKIDEWTNKEIAEALGIEQNTVSATFTRVRRHKVIPAYNRLYGGR